MRQKFKVTYVDPTIHKTKNDGDETEYQMGDATDGTSFNGEAIAFHFSCAANEVGVGDIISGLLNDRRTPQYIHEVFVEHKYVDPATVVEVAPVVVAQVEPEDMAPQADELTTAVWHGQYLSPLDVFALARRFLVVEKELKEHLEKCGK